MSYLLEEVAPGEGIGTAESISAIISDFYKQYYDNRGERHPILTDVVYTKVIIKLLESIDVIWKEGHYLDMEAYGAMAEKFFQKKYGVKSGNTTDYRLPYFLQDTVLENLYYQSGLH